MEDPNVHPLWAAETKQLAREIDRLDYFQILGVRPEARLDEIKAQYHALQRTYHPDTFYQSPDEDLRRSVFLISKRIAEAYVILRDSGRRAKYARDIAGPERSSKLRFTDETEQEVRKEKEAELGRTPQGRQLVQKAMMAANKGDFASAERDLKMAILFEKGNEAIQKRLDDVQAQLKAKK
ncbi:MAG: DnaJ domain-containing protein [Deltaproteobacteria bacterium]|nr:DnaJ domain-containing protein [Deltaproteobacteria bacterium]